MEGRGRRQPRTKALSSARAPSVGRRASAPRQPWPSAPASADRLDLFAWRPRMIRAAGVGIVAGGLAPLVARGGEDLRGPCWPAGRRWSGRGLAEQGLHPPSAPLPPDGAPLSWPPEPLLTGRRRPLFAPGRAAAASSGRTGPRSSSRRPPGLVLPPASAASGIPGRILRLDHLRAVAQAVAARLVTTWSPTVQPRRYGGLSRPWAGPVFDRPSPSRLGNPAEDDIDEVALRGPWRMATAGRSPRRYAGCRPGSITLTNCDREHRRRSDWRSGPWPFTVPVVGSI